MIERVAAATEGYAYKVWGFGESIAMQALLAAKPDFAEALLLRWARGAGRLAEEPLAHVAPGVPLLELYGRTGDAVLLERAVELGHVLAGTRTGKHGARIHRPDLAGWEHEVWVDCMHLDAPFLIRLAPHDDTCDWTDLAVDALLSHARVLQDERTGLFSHGFDDAAGEANGVFWGRGQGWALLGLVDTLTQRPSPNPLPEGEGIHPGDTEIRQRLHALVDALAKYEAADGRWHTVVDAPETYLEPSVSAFVALGVGDALSSGLVSNGYEPLARRALEATCAGIDASGQLVGVSDATPVGANAAHYAQRPVGTFPWGQGPALLALVHSKEPELV